MIQKDVKFNKKNYLSQFLDNLNILWLVPKDIKDDFYRFEVY